MANKAIVAYSFGGSPINGPGRANNKLAEIVLKQVIKMNSLAVHVLVQDYLKISLGKLNFIPDLVVSERRQPERFLGTEEVTSQFAEYLCQHNISQVTLVAHSFLHWKKCKRLLEGEGLIVEVADTGWVPFDRNCENWWVRSPLHLALYGLLQKCFGRQGH